MRVKWINELVDAQRQLPAAPAAGRPDAALGEPARRARRVATRGRRSTRRPGRYTGPVPIVTHVHGAVGVGDESDGYAEAWYLPAAGNIPAGYATEGTWYDFFAGKAAATFGVDVGAGLRDVPVPERPARVDDLVPRPHPGHDPAQRVRRARPASSSIRGGPDGDEAVLDSRSGTTAVLPGPAPKEGDKFPPNKTYYEIPIAIQDRSFNADGSLFYPDTRAFFDGIAGPYIPDTDVLADLEPGVLRQHDHGQRQHLAVPDRRAAALPAPLPQRLPVPLPDPRLRQHPRRRGLADRQRGRLPGRAGQPHGRPTATGC